MMYTEQVGSGSVCACDRVCQWPLALALFSCKPGGALSARPVQRGAISLQWLVAVEYLLPSSST